MGTKKKHQTLQRGKACRARVQEEKPSTINHQPRTLQRGNASRTRHVDVRNFYLRELKDEGLLSIEHVPGVENDADIFTKNTPYGIFNKHVRQFVGEDEYVDQDTQTPE